MISDTHRCIFVHVPKCGGSSIEAVLWPEPRTEAELWMGFVDEFHNRHQTGGLQHLHATQIRAEVGERFDAYFTFAFVRNPFDRLVSQFASMRSRPDLRAFIGMDDDASFSRYLDLIEQRTHVQWEPQCAFLDIDVDFVGRFETFEADVKHVFGRLGVEVDAIPHVLRGERGPYRDYYDARTRATVERLYASDLERFKYQF
jgi:hypothetical protein